MKQGKLIGRAVNILGGTHGGRAADIAVVDLNGDMRYGNIIKVTGRKVPVGKFERIATATDAFPGNRPKTTKIPLTPKVQPVAGSAGASTVAKANPNLSRSVVDPFTGKNTPIKSIKSMAGGGVLRDGKRIADDDPSLSIDKRKRGGRPGDADGDGRGKGNWGHKGRPGQRGGSA